MLRAVRPQDAGPDGNLQAAAFVITRVFAEVMAGIRPLHHVAGRATPAVYDRLARRLPPTGALGRRRARPRILMPRVQEPAPGVAEVSAVAFTGTLAQAIALRLERFHGRWRCSAVETTISPR
jgi:hypothetical protein